MGKLADGRPRAGQVGNGLEADPCRLQEAASSWDPFSLQPALLAYAGKQFVELLHLLRQSGCRAL